MQKVQIGYARVSTDDQNSNLQLDALEATGCDQIFQDEGISGAAINRPGLDEALAALQSGDVLVVWKLDRLGRSLSNLITIIEDLGKRGIGFKSLSEAIDTTTASGELLFHIMGSLAHFERKLIAERTKAGLQAAKKRGKRLGRPKRLTQHQIDRAYEMIQSKQDTISGIAELYGVNRTTLYRALKR